jgi:hypothetical protein
MQFLEVAQPTTHERDFAYNAPSLKCPFDGSLFAGREAGPLFASVSVGLAEKNS